MHTCSGTHLNARVCFSWCPKTRNRENPGTYITITREGRDPIFVVLNPSSILSVRPGRLQEESQVTYNIIFLPHIRQYIKLRQITMKKVLDSKQ